MSTFRRQLYLYGFAGLKTGSDKGSFYHMLFLRHRPELCSFIFRKNYAIAVPSQEPNLYMLPGCPKLDYGTVSNKGVGQLPAPSTLSSTIAIFPSCGPTGQKSSASNPELRNTYSSEDRTFKVSGVDDNPMDSSCPPIYMPTDIPGHSHSQHRPLTIADRRSVNNTEPLEYTIAVPALSSVTGQARIKKSTDNCAHFRTPVEAPSYFDMFQNISPPSEPEEIDHTRSRCEMDLLSSHSSPLQDVASRSAENTVNATFNSNVESFANIPDNLSQTSQDLFLPMAPTIDTVLHYGYAAAGCDPSLQASRHESSANPNPALETEPFPLLEPEPLSEEDLAVCFYIRANRQS